jgi:hypothetical protein
LLSAQSGARAQYAVLALAALVLVEALVAPWPLTRLAATPETVAMQADPTPGAVLELPPRLNDAQALLNQICHGRPLLGGYLARLPFYPAVSFPSATRALWLAEAPAPDMFRPDAAAELASLGVRYVSLDRTELPRSAQTRLAEWLHAPGITEVSRSEARVLYAVEPALARPAVALGAGWYAAERDGERVWRWMGQRGELRLLARQHAVVSLSLRATAFGEARSLALLQGAQMLGTVEIPAAPADRTVTLRLLLPPGQTTLALESPAELAPDGRALSLSIEQVQLTSLPVSATWAGEATLALPTTIPAMGGAPCAGS